MEPIFPHYIVSLMILFVKPLVKPLSTLLLTALKILQNATMRALDLGLLFINLILPIPLIYFSYKAHREIEKMRR